MSIKQSNEALFIRKQAFIYSIHLMHGNYVVMEMVMHIENSAISLVSYLAFPRVCVRDVCSLWQKLKPA